MRISSGGRVIGVTSPADSADGLALVNGRSRPSTCRPRSDVARLSYPPAPWCRRAGRSGHLPGETPVSNPSYSLGAHYSDRDSHHRAAGGEHAHPRLGLAELAWGLPVPFGKDAQGSACLENLQRAGHRLPVRLASPHGEGAHTVHDPAKWSELPELGFCHEVDLPRGAQSGEDGVGVGDVVTGQEHAAFARNVLQAGDLHPVQDAERGRQPEMKKAVEARIEGPPQHRSWSPCPRRSASDTIAATTSSMDMVVVSRSSASLALRKGASARPES